MMRPIRLKWFVALAFLSLGLVLVVAYALLAVHYFMRGMDGMTVANLEQVAVSYLDSVPAHEDPRRFGAYQVAPYWEQLPTPIREAFGAPPTQPNVLFKHDDSDWLTAPDVIYFLMRFERAAETVFVVNTVSRETTSALVEREVGASLRMLAIISAASAVVLAFVIWLLMRQVSRPVAALGRWTHELRPEGFEDPIPDFSYPELNELAELIRGSLSSVQQGLEREHRFLRHASHELRTPISVIRNNVELMRKLQARARVVQDSRQGQIVDRIDRASLTMKHLTETLLWLSRDNGEPMARSSVALHMLVRQAVDETRYLLSDKQVTVDLHTEPCVVVAAEIPARIVLRNLISNAFKHTWEGRVTIHQQGNRVEVINQQRENRPDECGDPGFGLGLQLTEQLTRRLGWVYCNEPGPFGHRAEVYVGEPEYEAHQRDNV